MRATKHNENKVFGTVEFSGHTMAYLSESVKPTACRINGTYLCQIARQLINLLKNYRNPGPNPSCITDLCSNDEFGKGSKNS